MSAETPPLRDPSSAFRPVPRTGVIYVMTEAARKGFHYGHPDWANLGQGAPETGALEGAPARVTSIDVDIHNHEYTPVGGLPALREAVAKGQSGTGAFVIEASKGGCTPDASCIASYLLAAEEFTYLGCLADEPQLPRYPDLERPLGPPRGPAVQAEDGTWSRSFEHGAVARWYPNASSGTVQWPGEPEPPIPAPPPPAPPLDPEVCGTVLKDHTFSQDDVGHGTTKSAGECCQMCERARAPGKVCTQWAWHGSTDRSCHLHDAQSSLHAQKGTTAAYMPNRTAHRGE